MSNQNSVDSPQINPSNPSSTNSMIRSKKLPPPPLCLPASNTTTDEERLLNSNQQFEQTKSTNNCYLSSSSKECPHEHIPYILPIGQRSQILETLINSSSTLLVPPTSETKQRKSQTSINSNQTNLLNQHLVSRQGTVTDSEWLDFIRFIVYKPLENELKMLLDKYKTTYFDRVNSPNTTDATIRAILCDMVSQTLSTYSTGSSSSSIVANNAPPNVHSSVITTSISNNGSAKRKRNDKNAVISESSTIAINNQTKFVISYIIPGKYDNTLNSNKMTYQQRHKQFQNKYSHLFKYIPDKDEQVYLVREGHLQNSPTSSFRSSNNEINNICLMLYDEVLVYMDEYDLELSGISIDDSFTLSESILTHIHSNENIYS